MSYLQTLCFRGKCLLTCLYGRVEVMGFTIEEGQQSYSLFSPASHCPLSIRGLESIRALKSRNEASHILQKYLPQGEQHTFSFMFEVRHLYWFFQLKYSTRKSDWLEFILYRQKYCEFYLAGPYFSLQSLDFFKLIII